jgi:hypothetical protein
MKKSAKQKRFSEQEKTAFVFLRNVNKCKNDFNKSRKPKPELSEIKVYKRLR